MSTEQLTPKSPELDYEAYKEKVAVLQAQCLMLKDEQRNCQEEGRYKRAIELDLEIDQSFRIYSFHRIKLENLDPQKSSIRPEINTQAIPNISEGVTEIKEPSIENIRPLDKLYDGELNVLLKILDSTTTARNLHTSLSIAFDQLGRVLSTLNKLLGTGTSSGTADSIINIRGFAIKNNISINDVKMAIQNYNVNEVNVKAYRNWLNRREDLEQAKKLYLESVKNLNETVLNQ